MPLWHSPSNQHGKRLRKRYGKNRSHLFTFLDHPDTPPDNNGSERELRPTATYRKVTGGFRSNWGADLFAAVRSVVGTAARHGADAYQAIHAILGGAFGAPRAVEQLPRPTSFANGKNALLVPSDHTKGDKPAIVRFVRSKWAHGTVIWLLSLGVDPRWAARCLSCGLRLAALAMLALALARGMPGARGRAGWFCRRAGLCGMPRDGGRALGGIAPRAGDAEGDAGDGAGRFRRRQARTTSASSPAFRDQATGSWCAPTGPTGRSTITRSPTPSASTRCSSI